MIRRFVILLTAIALTAIQAQAQSSKSALELNPELKSQLLGLIRADSQ